MVFNYKDTLQNNYKKVNSEYDKLKEANDSIFITDVDGISGLTLDITNDEKVRLQSSITDYVLENGSVVQNNITLQPINIELRGFIGELVVKKPRRVKETNFIQSRLNKLTGILPELSTQAQQYLNTFNDTVEKIDEYNTKISNTFDLVNSSFTKDLKSNQKKQFNILFDFWKSKTILSVKTSWMDFENIVIESVEVGQTDTLYKTEISIKLKQLSFAELKTAKKREGRNNIQASEVVDKGKTKGKSIITSIKEKIKWGLFS